MRLKTVGSMAFAAIALSAATVAQAAPTIYFGENQSPGGAVTGAPKTAHDAFLAAITGTGVETFESFADGSTTPLALTFTGSTITASLTGDGTIIETAVPTNGRFNTTSGGDSFLESNSGVFAIAFSTPVSAFGFYGTDIGDFAGQVTIALTDVNDLVTNFTVNNTEGADGALLFWGFTDTGNTYKSVSFGHTLTELADVNGFDDMIIGNAATTAVPEPATLALFGIGLAGLGFARRKH